MDTGGNGNGNTTAPRPSPFDGVNVEAMVETEVVSAIKEYLARMHCSGFGRSFSVHDDKGREECARWLAPHIFGVFDVLLQDQP